MAIMKGTSWLLAAAVWLACVSQLHGQLILECYPTPEFSSYTSAAQDVRVAFTIKAPQTVSTVAPLSLTTVLDRSGSMAGTKMDLLKKTNQFLVSTLEEFNGLHTLGSVIYGDNVIELAQLQKISSENAPLFDQSIESIFAEGQTYLSGGLQTGLIQQSNGPSGAIKSVFLFTDGLPNIGTTSKEGILSEVRAILDNSPDTITISSFGFGEDLDVGLLKAISDEAGGETYIISGENDIPVAFGDALGGLISIAAQDIDVIFRPQNGATINEIETGGDVTPVDGGGIKISYRNLYAEERRDMVLTLSVPADVSKIIDFEIEYTDAATVQRVSKENGVWIDRSATETVFVTLVPQPIVQTTIIQFEIADAVSQAQVLVASGDPTAATEVLQQAQQEVEEEEDVEEEPLILSMLNDLRKVTEVVGDIVDNVVDDSSGTSLLDRFSSVIRRQRRVASTEDEEAELATERSFDTTEKKETRERSRSTVLNAEPLPPPPPEGLVTLEADLDEEDEDDDEEEGDTSGGNENDEDNNDAVSVTVNVDVDDDDDEGGETAEDEAGTEGSSSGDITLDSSSEEEAAGSTAALIADGPAAEIGSDAEEDSDASALLAEGGPAAESTSDRETRREARREARRAERIASRTGQTSNGTGLEGNVALEPETEPDTAEDGDPVVIQEQTNTSPAPEAESEGQTLDGTVTTTALTADAPGGDSGSNAEQGSGASVSSSNGVSAPETESVPAVEAEADAEQDSGASMSTSNGVPGPETESGSTVEGGLQTGDAVQLRGAGQGQLDAFQILGGQDGSQASDEAGSASGGAAGVTVEEPAQEQVPQAEPADPQDGGGAVAGLPSQSLPVDQRPGLAQGGAPSGGDNPDGEGSDVGALGGQGSADGAPSQEPEQAAMQGGVSKGDDESSMGEASSEAATDPEQKEEEGGQGTELGGGDLTEDEAVDGDASLAPSPAAENVTDVSPTGVQDGGAGAVVAEQVTEQVTAQPTLPIETGEGALPGQTAGATLPGQTTGAAGGAINPVIVAPAAAGVPGFDGLDLGAGAG